MWVQTANDVFLVTEFLNQILKKHTVFSFLFKNMHVLWSPITVPVLQQTIYLILHLYRHLEKFLWGFRKPNKIALFSFLKIQWEEQFWFFSFLELSST